MFPNFRNRLRSLEIRNRIPEYRSSGCLDSTLHKPYMFVVVVNGELKIANIAYKILRRNILVVQAIFTIKC